MNTTPNPTPVTITPADTLRAAATYLRLHGWTQDEYYDRSAATQFPPACSIAAIGMAVHGQALDDPQDPALPAGRDYFEAYRALRYHIRLADPFDGDQDYTLSDWNDLPEQTAEKVIAVLNAAADAWDSTLGGAA